MASNSESFKLSLSRIATTLNNAIPLVCWPLMAAVIVQYHVLSYGFLYDDYVHLYNVANFPFIEAISQTTGGHLLHSFNFSVWILKALFGPTAFAFLLVGLMVHLACVWLIFAIVARLARSENVAALGATLWGVSPFMAGTLGWFSVHGQAYATAALLWVLLDLVRSSVANSTLSRPVLGRHILLLLLAATSFGTGLASALAMVLVVALWNPVPGQRVRLLVVYAVAALLVTALYVYTMAQYGEAVGGVGGATNLILQSIENVTQTIAATFELVAVGFSSLVMGPLFVGKIALVSKEGLITVATVATLVVALPLFLASVAFSDNTKRRQILAFLLLCFAAYGMIAVARAGGFFPFKADVPRYHYLPLAFLSVAVCLMFSAVSRKLPATLLAYGRVTYFLWLIAVIVPFALAPVSPVKEAAQRGQEKQYRAGLRKLNAALQKNADGQSIYIRNTPYRVFIWGDTPEHFPGLAALFVMSYPNNTVNGKQVFFLEDSEEVVQMAKAQRGTRISKLLVHPASVERH